MELQDPDIDLSDKLKYLLEDTTRIDTLLGEYEYIQLDIYFQLLSEISGSESLTYLDKYRILNALYIYDETDRDKVKQLISAYIPQSATIEFKVIEWLLSFGDSDEYYPRLYKYLSNPLSDKIRYSQLMSLKLKYPQATLAGVKYFYTQDISTACRILVCQFLLQNHDSEEMTDSIFSTLITITCDDKETLNTRADAADTLHHYSTGQIQQQAIELLTELGGKCRTLYESKQNVHAVEISGALKVLVYEPTIRIDEIIKYFHQLEDQAVNASLGRIFIDVATYGNQEKYTALQILERLWTYIQVSPHKQELERRMIEELQEMADTCSSGHAIRLLNVMSGYISDGLSICVEDQIIANFKGRINARLRQEEKNLSTQSSSSSKSNIIDLDAIEIKEEPESLLSQVLVSDRDVGLIACVHVRGKEFLKFFGKSMPLVIEELRKEFVPEFIDTEKFESTLRMAIDNYLGEK
jgi:hypothetical protein